MFIFSFLILWSRSVLGQSDQCFWVTIPTCNDAIQGSKKFSPPCLAKSERRRKRRYISSVDDYIDDFIDDQGDSKIEMKFRKRKYKLSFESNEKNQACCKYDDLWGMLTKQTYLAKYFNHEKKNFRGKKTMKKFQDMRGNSRTECESIRTNSKIKINDEEQFIEFCMQSLARNVDQLETTKLDQLPVLINALYAGKKFGKKTRSVPCTLLVAQIIGSPDEIPCLYAKYQDPEGYKDISSCPQELQRSKRLNPAGRAGPVGKTTQKAKTESAAPTEPDDPGYTPCPSSHPFVFNNRKSCCSSHREDGKKGDDWKCNGSVIGVGSSCCAGKEKKCPKSPCKNHAEWKINKSKGECFKKCGDKAGACHNNYCGYGGYCCSKHYYILPSMKHKNGNCDKEMRKSMWKQTASLQHMCIQVEGKVAAKEWKMDKSKPDCYDYCGKKGGTCESYCGKGGKCCSKHYFIMNKANKNGNCSKDIRKAMWKQTVSLKHWCVTLR